MRELCDAVVTWMSGHTGLLVGLSMASLVLLVGSALLLPVLIARLPRNYFRDRCWRSCDTREDEACPPRWHPVLHAAWVVSRNLLGWLLLLAGFVMIVTPGQGVLTIVLGLMLIDFPLKDELICRLISQRTTWRAINWVRRRTHREPFLPLDDPSASAG